MIELHGISSVGENGRCSVRLQDGSLLSFKPDRRWLGQQARAVCCAAAGSEHGSLEASQSAQKVEMWAFAAKPEPAVGFGGIEWEALFTRQTVQYSTVV